jgi:hypothetical protein
MDKDFSTQKGNDSTRPQRAYQVLYSRLHVQHCKLGYRSMSKDHGGGQRVISLWNRQTFE